MSNYNRNLIGTIVAGSLFTAISSIHAAEIYQIDPDHSYVGFAVKHMMISKVRGNFAEFQGQLQVVDGELSSCNGTVQIKSIDTGVIKRDDHLRSADFFDAAEYPEMVFETTRVEKRKGATVVVGKLTLHGITRELNLPVAVAGPAKDPWGNMRIGFEAHVTINRKDYGLTWNQTLENGELLVGEEVEIILQFEGVLRK